MKKIYIVALAFALVSTGSFAQSSAETKTAKPEMKSELTTSVLKSAKGKQDYQKDLQVEIWSDDFSDPSTWDIAHDEATCSLDWEIGVGLTNQGDYPTGPIESTTAANGYAMLDSDYYGQTVSTSDAEDSWFTTASSIDLTGYDNVVLEFESLYRAFNNNSLYVVVSTNNTDWPDLFEGYDPSTNPNVWQVFENIDVNSSTANPVTTAINISEVAGGESTVWIRFNWTGTWGYSWFVDDVKINELPDNDMVLDYGVISHNGTGDEYGRVPVSQLYPQMYYAALSTNIGRLAQTDVVIDVVTVDSDNVEVLNISSDVEASVAPDAEFMFESDEDQSLELGLYTTTFTVTSAEETDGDNFANNVEVRNFEITDNLYSLDGIGVHDVSLLTSLGTNSFTDGADGFMMMVYYDIYEDESELYGVEFLLTSTTVPGGSVFVHLLDTADVFADITDEPLASSDEHIITQDDVDAGVVQLYFENSYSAPTDAYFVAVEMYSEDNQYDIRILDDVTVPQPSTSSMIYIPNDQVYTNGNAAAIRLITMAPNSIQEIEKVAVLGQNVPNPASDRTTISFELLDNQEVSVRLTDMLGKVIIEENLGNLTPGTHQYTFELAGLQAGSYHYSIVSDKGSISKAMQIIK
jgi:hypothetical protein